ncbi:MAG: peptidoglycan-associated lipoprotein Pal, partial [Deltaproteobacteria bacterium]
MRRGLAGIVFVVFVSLLLVQGCAKRQLTKSEMDRVSRVEAKIAEAERMDAKECAPKELAKAKVALEHARHELVEHHEEGVEDLKYAEKVADELLEKTRPCFEAKQVKPAPTASLSADPENIEKGQCSTLSWSSENAETAEIEGIGAVATSGSREVCPEETSTYTLIAAGPGGTARATATVTVTAPPPVEKPVVKEEIPRFENIHFDFDRADIRPDAKPILEALGKYLLSHPDKTVLIEGHCDERGTNEYNFALGERRASAAKAYLVNLGVSADRIKTVSYGEERPLDPGHNEEAWAKN